MPLSEKWQKVIIFGLNAILHGFLQQIIINNLARHCDRIKNSSELGVGHIHSFFPHPQFLTFSEVVLHLSYLPKVIQPLVIFFQLLIKVLGPWLV